MIMMSSGNFSGRISGSLVLYYLICPREAWFASRDIRMEQTSELVDLGKAIDELYNSSGRTHVHIMRSEIDLIKMDKGKLKIVEIKKSSKLINAHVMQVMYYLYLLKTLGVDAIGELRYPLENKRIPVLLDEQKILDLILHLSKLLSLKYPPPPRRRSYCRKCSYYEYCWV